MPPDDWTFEEELFVRFGFVDDIGTLRYDRRRGMALVETMDETTMEQAPITFGFEGGAKEGSLGTSSYAVYFPKFATVAISHDWSYMIYTLHTEDFKKVHRMECKGILQAYSLILGLLKHHNRLEFLPAGLRDFDENNPYDDLIDLPGKVNVTLTQKDD